MLRLKPLLFLHVSTEKRQMGCPTPYDVLLCRGPIRGEMRNELDLRHRRKNREALRMRGTICCGLVLILGMAASAGSESTTAAKMSAGQTAGAKRKTEETKSVKSAAKTYVLVGAGDIAGCSSLAGAAGT